MSEALAYTHMEPIEQDIAVISEGPFLHVLPGDEAEEIVTKSTII